MRALTVAPGHANSARVEEVPEPSAADGPVLVQTLGVGVCGTDLEIVNGEYGWPPAGRDRLVLGHESLGRVLEAPTGSGLTPGDLVAGIVRRPDPVPCPNCAAGEWDMCRNGRYTERGIKERDGFCSERYRIHPEYTVKLAPHLGPLGVLLEPTSVLAKAWEHAERVGRRAVWEPKRALVIGAGPIGLLAALLGRQRGLAVDVLDRIADGPKPTIARELGATYHTGDVREVAAEADVVIECTGVGAVVDGVLSAVKPGCVVALTGIMPEGHPRPMDLAGINKRMVLGNVAVVGSVNANRRHWEAAAAALAAADAGWLGHLVTRRVPLDGWRDALERRADDVKTVIELNGDH